jgi:hypothetical protein
MIGPPGAKFVADARTRTIDTFDLGAIQSGWSERREGSPGNASVVDGDERTQPGCDRNLISTLPELWRAGAYSSSSVARERRTGRSTWARLGGCPATR